MPFNQTEIKKFVHTASFSGKLSIFYMLIAYRKKIGVLLADLKNFNTISSTDYAYGFIIATSCAGLLEFNLNERVLTVTSFNETLEKELIPALLENAKKYDAKKENELFQRLPVINAIAKHYGFDLTAYK